MDRQGDYSGARWRGKVVNVMDPTQQGRFQIRIFGMHDDSSLIPDKDLPWAVARVPINSGASMRGVSASPVGVIPGSIVDGYFGDNDRTILIATGTLLSAGKTKSGETVNGSYALDDKFNDVTNSARGHDLNAALGLRNLPAISQIGAEFPTASAGVGAVKETSGDILSTLRQVDPKNASGSLAKSVEGFLKIDGVGQLGQLSALTGGLATVTQTISKIQSAGSTLQSTVSGASSTLTSVTGTVTGGTGSITTQLQSGTSSLISSFGSVQGAQSLVSSLSNISPSSLADPTKLAKGFPVIGNIIGIAMTLFGGGGITQLINNFMSNMSFTNKLREYALEAADPTEPPALTPPAATTSKADTGAGGGGGGGDTTPPELPPVVTSEEVLNSILNGGASAAAPTEVTAAEFQTDATAENLDIMNQLQQQTQQA